MCDEYPARGEMVKSFYPMSQIAHHTALLFKWVCCNAMTFFLLGVLPSSAWAGAWCMKEGSVYSKLSYNYYFTVDTFDDDGHKHRNPNGSNFRDENITWYNEYGLFDNFTLFASVPYKMLYSKVRSIEPVGDAKRLKRTSDRYDGLGDVDLGVRYGLLKDPVVLSLQFLTKVAWFYDGDEDVPPGNNQNDYELKMLLGKSLWPFPGYCGLELGYRWRTSAPSDEYRYLVEFGMNPTKKCSFRVKLDGIASVKNASLPGQKPTVSSYIDYDTGQLIKTVSAPAGAGAAFTNPSLGYEYDLGKLELTLGYQQNKNWSFEFTYTNYPYGESIAAGDQYSLALVYYFSKQ
jgi:hypothetical protein